MGTDDNLPEESRISVDMQNQASNTKEEYTDTQEIMW